MSSSILALGLVFPKTALFREEATGKPMKKKGSGLNFGPSHPGKKPKSKALQDSVYRETFPQTGDKSVRHPSPLGVATPAWTEVD